MRKSRCQERPDGGCPDPKHGQALAPQYIFTAKGKGKSDTYWTATREEKRVRNKRAKRWTAHGAHSGSRKKTKPNRANEGSGLLFAIKRKIVNDPVNLHQQQGCNQQNEDCEEFYKDNNLGFSIKIKVLKVFLTYREGMGRVEGGGSEIQCNIWEKNKNSLQVWEL